jgi:Leucine-rich repeat (LRR) protein
MGDELRDGPTSQSLRRPVTSSHCDTRGKATQRPRLSSGRERNASLSYRDTMPASRIGQRERASAIQSLLREAAHRTANAARQAASKLS